MSKHKKIKKILSTCIASVGFGLLSFSIETVKAAEIPSISDVKAKTDSQSIIKYYWKVHDQDGSDLTLTLTYDNNSKVLTIPGRTTPIKDISQLQGSVDRKDEVKKIIISGPLKIIGSANAMFKNFPNLESIEGLDKLDTSEVVDMGGMFAEDPSLKVLDISSLNTSKVNNMKNMFSCMIDYYFPSRKSSKLEKIIFGDKFDTSHVTNMYEMFTNLRNLRELDLSKFDTSKIEDGKMDWFFVDCRNLRKLVLGPKVKFVGDPMLHETWLNDQNDKFAEGVWVNNGESNNPQAPRGTHLFTNKGLTSNYRGEWYDTYRILAEPCPNE